jgi:hypothetical protein
MALFLLRNVPNSFTFVALRLRHYFTGRLWFRLDVLICTLGIMGYGGEFDIWGSAVDSSCRHCSDNLSCGSLR